MKNNCFIRKYNLPDEFAYIIRIPNNIFSEFLLLVNFKPYSGNRSDLPQRILHLL